MTTTLAAGLGCLAACLFAAPVQAQAPEQLAAEPAVTAMVRDASIRIGRAAAAMGYERHALFLRAIAIETGPRRSVGTMNRIGVARIDARFARAAGLTSDDIAWVIAHEFAHFILNHPARRAVVAHAYAGARDRTAANKAHELEADRLGLRLATAAGFAFDPQAFFARLRKGRLAGESASHPADGVRIQVMQSAARGAS